MAISSDTLNQPHDQQEQADDGVGMSHIDEGADFEQDATMWSDSLLCTSTANCILDELGVARVRMDYERQQNLNCCEQLVLTATALREDMRCWDLPDSAIDAVEQLRLDSELIASQLEILRSLEAHLADLERNAHKMTPRVSETEISCTFHPRPSQSHEGLHLLHQYIRREGDASIVRERISDMDEELTFRRSELDLDSTDNHDDLRRLYHSRSQLHSELRNAQKDAEVLKALCIEQGLDPERAKYSWRSSRWFQATTAQLY